MVNALAPMAVLRGALQYLGSGGVMEAITATAVDRPQPGLAGPETVVSRSLHPACLKRRKDQ